MIKEKQLYSIKMNSGEELIGKVAAVDDKEVTLERCYSVGFTQQGPQLVPSLLTADPVKEVNLKINNIALYADAADDMVDMYRELTTGIKAPTKQIITG
jgi:hypothetical protein